MCIRDRWYQRRVRGATPQGQSQAQPQGRGGPPQSQPQQSQGRGAPAGGRGAPAGRGAPTTTTTTTTTTSTAVVPGGGRFPPRISDDDLKVAPRPVQTGGQRVGRPIHLVVNHFKFAIMEQYVYQYDVQFNPPNDSKGSKHAILRTKEPELGKFVFDGTMLFSLKRVPALTFTSVSPNGVSYTIEITFTKELPPNSPDLPLQVYNMLFRQILRSLKMKQMGRHYFNPNNPTQIKEHKLELWPGYITSINPNDTGIVLIADIAHKVLRTDTVLDYFYEVYNNQRNQAAAEAMIREQLIGQIVLTRYNNRTYRIDAIDWKQNPSSTFEKRSGEKMSYFKYYDQVYQRKLRDLEQPLLVHNHKRRGGGQETIYLIPELCSMTGFTDAMRNDFTLMKDLAVHTRVAPEQRGVQLEAFTKQINSHETVRKDLAEWNLLLSQGMLQVQGRILPPETIHFKTSKTASPNADWSNDTKKSVVLQPIDLARWLLISPERVSQAAYSLVDNLPKVGAPLGIRVAKPQSIVLRDDRPQSYANALMDNIRPDLQIVVCILPQQKKDRYDVIKQICSKDNPIPSQCIVQRSLGKPATLLSVCGKILQQINCKLGGQLWRLDIPLTSTMIIGIDVCHDTSGGSQSVAGFCASINPTITRYYSRVTFQTSGQELVDGLKVCMKEALRKYFEVNKILPEKIIVYRDGVGDGMLEGVVTHEVPQFQETFSELGNGYLPQLAVIVVKKRIHTRLFERGAALNNPPPGTVADHTCTHRGWYDFFLVSQSVRQGTVTPTHYHVVYDTTQLSPDHMQMLTFKMCHLYYNWPGTIRVPAPCQYAHKLAFLVGQSIHCDPAPVLRDTLYFL
eukprot:TRINITY_DN1311_c0_g2_i1.p1 TRINITY_DN1311_c0_g2~~TRINITY_DN1311_c0_g2_i1.p1  ORF type:complete len:848 (-),score=209.79 TRINITY_DN1311_c0_g2_i1:183-2726(-)